MKPGEAVMKLTALGYRFEAAGERLRWRFEGQGKPDPGQVRPLLQLVKECGARCCSFCGVIAKNAEGRCSSLTSRDETCARLATGTHSLNYTLD
ncbi:MAG: hypothetical protein ACOZFS_15055 [Thermodesulfobacteriota bacterium]